MESIEVVKSHLCIVCRRQTKTIKKCSRCQLKHYCSIECQKVDWKNGHREQCQPVPTSFPDSEKEFSVSIAQKHFAKNTHLNYILMIILSTMKKIRQDEILIPIIAYIGEPWKDETANIILSFSFTKIIEFEKHVKQNLIDLGRESELKDLEKIPYLQARFFSKKRDEDGNIAFHYVDSQNYYLWNKYPESERGKSGTILRSTHIQYNFPNQTNVEKEVSSETTQEAYEVICQTMKISSSDLESGRYGFEIKGESLQVTESFKIPFLSIILSLEKGSKWIFE